MVEITAAVGAVTCNSEVDGRHGKQRAKMGKDGQSSSSTR